MQTLAEFLKKCRRDAKITQEDLAWKSGVGLRFIRDLEQGKKTLRMDKVNQVLYMFGHHLAPQRGVPNRTDPDQEIKTEDAE